MFRQIIALTFTLAAAGCAVEEKAEGLLLQEVAARLGKALHKEPDEKSFTFPISIALQADEE